MPLLKSYEVARLEKALGGLLGGLGLLEWTDRITSDLVCDVKDEGEWDKLPHQLLGKRRIIEVSEVRSGPRITDWGRLVIGRKGFVVELPVVLSRQPLWRRFALAHEVGHTFFYDVATWPPTRRTFLPSGSKDLEWVCDAIASRLLVPAARLREELGKYAAPQATSFSLSPLRRMERVFRAPWRIIAQRVVDDGAWRGILLQLRGYERPPAKPAHATKWNLEWFLEWYCAPPDLLDHLGITTAFRSSAGERRFRRVWGDLVELVTRWTAVDERSSHRTEHVPVHVFRLGQLPKLLEEMHEGSEIRVVAGVKTFSGGAGSNALAGRRRPKASVVLYLPLTSAHKTETPSAMVG